MKAKSATELKKKRLRPKPVMSIEPKPARKWRHDRAVTFFLRRKIDTYSLWEDDSRSGELIVKYVNHKVPDCYITMHRDLSTNRGEFDLTVGVRFGDDKSLRACWPAQGNKMRPPVDADAMVNILAKQKTISIRFSHPMTGRTVQQTYHVEGLWDKVEASEH